MLPRIVATDTTIGFHWASPEGVPMRLSSVIGLPGAEPDRWLPTHLEALDDVLIEVAGRFGEVLGGGRRPARDEWDDLAAASGRHLLQVTGTASLNGTLVINPTGIAPGSAVYHVVDSSGLSGTFTAVTLAPGSPLTLLPELTYGPDDATLQFLVTVSSVLTGGGPLAIGNGNNGNGNGNGNGRGRI